MSEVFRQPVYIVVASGQLRRYLLPAAINLIGRQLTEMGFRVDLHVNTDMPSSEHTPVNATFSEHQLSTPLQLAPGDIINEILGIKPGISTTLTSIHHPLQISVMGRSNTGKTLLCNIMAKVLQVPNPLFLSLDREHLVHDASMINDVVPELKDHIHIHIHQKILDTYTELSSVIGHYNLPATE